MTRPSGARCSSVGASRPPRRPVGRLEHGVEPVGRRLVRAEQPEGRRVGADHVAQELAEHPRRLARSVAGRSHLDRVVAEVRQAQVAQQQAAVGVRVGAHPPLAARAPARRAPGAARRLVEQLLGPVGAQPPRGARGARGSSRTSAIGTWCERQVPSTGLPSTSFGPVQPLGVRRMIIGQRGRTAVAGARRACWIAAISSRTASSVAAIAGARAGSSPATMYGA